MFFYQSGTPRNDPYQYFENTLCTHRLFSLHGSYKRAVLKWLDMALEAPEKQRPRAILLDSGAFTAWNAGQETTVEEVIDAYETFIERVPDGFFDEIWCINLDKIPGEAGRDPTPDEIKEAIHVSDINYRILTDKFGARILPVYHQGEPIERALELQDMVKTGSNYMCVSPRNDVHEGLRKEWSQQAHASLKGTRTHGLATTGNVMLQKVPWYSVDSAAWVLHGGYGMVDIFFENAPVPTYKNFFMSYEGGKEREKGKHYDSVDELTRASIDAAAARYGFTIEQLKTDSRVRTLVCMGELERYAKYIREHRKSYSAQDTLFGI